MSIHCIHYLNVPKLDVDYLAEIAELKAKIKALENPNPVDAILERIRGNDLNSEVCMRAWIEFQPHLWDWLSPQQHATYSLPLTVDEIALDDAEAELDGKRLIMERSLAERNGSIYHSRSLGSSSVDLKSGLLSLSQPASPAYSHESYAAVAGSLAWSIRLQHPRRLILHRAPIFSEDTLPLDGVTIVEIVDNLMKYSAVNLQPGSHLEWMMGSFVFKSMWSIVVFDIAAKTTTTFYFSDPEDPDRLPTEDERKALFVDIIAGCLEGLDNPMEEAERWSHLSVKICDVSAGHSGPLATRLLQMLSHEDPPTSIDIRHLKTYPSIRTPHHGLQAATAARAAQIGLLLESGRLSRKLLDLIRKE
ncbi:hypothetical protein P7C73_g3298, partial [Tremellales sp. Uapishka_1]